MSSQFLLLLAAPLCLAALVVLALSWDAPPARNLFGVSLLLLALEFLTPVVLGSVLRTSPNSSLPGITPYVRLVPLALASVLALVALRTLFRETLENAVDGGRTHRRHPLAPSVGSWFATPRFQCACPCARSGPAMCGCRFGCARESGCGAITRNQHAKNSCLGRGRFPIQDDAHLRLGHDGMGPGALPIISVFAGIVIRMYYLEHEPAHFHVAFRGGNAIFDLRGCLIAGDIRPSSVRRLIENWAHLHRFELEANWQRIRIGAPLERIEPLDRGSV